MAAMPDPTELEADRQRLEFLEAISRAISRRSEVLEVCYNARGPEQAVAAVAQMLEIPERLAMAVTDMQFRRLAESARSAIDAEQSEIRGRLQL